MRQRGESFGEPEVTLADNTILHADLGVSERVLWIWMRREDDPYNSIPALSALLNTPGVTDHISRTQYGQTDTHDGYTVLTTVKRYNGNKVAARLQKGDD